MVELSITSLLSLIAIASVVAFFVGNFLGFLRFRSAFTDGMLVGAKKTLTALLEVGLVDKAKLDEYVASKKNEQNAV